MTATSILAASAKTGDGDNASPKPLTERQIAAAEKKAAKTPPAATPRKRPKVDKGVVELTRLADRGHVYAPPALDLLVESGCTVRSWSSRPRGTAWTESKDWEIRVPRPTNAVRFSIFAHEVGHQLLHRADSNRKGLPKTPAGSWEAEIEAHEYEIEAFARFSLPGLDEIAETQGEYLAYAISKSLRSLKGEAYEKLFGKIAARVASSPLAPLFLGEKTFEAWYLPQFPAPVAE
jgi:hypothetical protein